VERPDADPGAIVEREVVIAAPPHIVFAHFTDPEMMCRWKGTSAELDPRPGGQYRVNVTGRNVVRGEYLEVVPYSRVVFTWGWEDPGNALPPGSSTVEVTLRPHQSGTHLRLRHHGLSGAGRESHAEGWDHYLGRLVIAAPGGDAGSDPWVER
jgi:uncharacterized protein YndB with AHSA1/START domain